MRGMGIRRCAGDRCVLAQLVLCLTTSLLAAGSASAQGGYPDRPAEASRLRGAYGFAVSGLPSFSRLGRTIAPAGDLNNDGVDDFVVTAFEDNEGAYVVFGRAGGFGDGVDVSALDGRNGFVISAFPGNMYARFARTIGDLNHDGVDDLFVSGGRAWPSAGLIVFGRADGVFPTEIHASRLTASDGVVLSLAADRTRPLQAEAWANGAAAGDFNGDGIDDVVISTAWLRTEPETESKAYVLFGSADAFPASIDLEALDGTSGFVIVPQAIDDYLGISVSGAGDLNGDGLADIVLGAPGSRGSIAVPFRTAGKAHVVFGTPSPPAELDLAQLDGTNGFTLHPTDGQNIGLGYGVAVAGDANGDGRDDVAIGAPDGGPLSQGEVYVLYGRDAFDAEYRTGALTAEDALVITGREIDDAHLASMGWSVGSGDPNGDGVPDIILGDPSIGSVPVMSSVHVVFGRAGGGPIVPGGVLAVDDLDGQSGFTVRWSQVRGEFLGGSVNGLGDINADGVEDIGFGANTADGFAGRAFVHLGGGLCEVDLNGDRRADLFDALAFLNLFQARDPIADWEIDGLLRASDLPAFLDDLDRGCP